jgi:metal-responsive CopG/Arc/MetJ family transcriptional regulator
MNLNVDLPKALIDSMDAVREKEGYATRSEFVREAIRDKLRAKSVYEE